MADFIVVLTVLTVLTAVAFAANIHKASANLQLQGTDIHAVCDFQFQHIICLAMAP